MTVTKKYVYIVPCRRKIFTQLLRQNFLLKSELFKHLIHVASAIWTVITQIVNSSNYIKYYKYYSYLKFFLKNSQFYYMNYFKETWKKIKYNDVYIYLF